MIVILVVVVVVHFQARKHSQQGYEFAKDWLGLTAEVLRLNSMQP